MLSMSTATETEPLLSPDLLARLEIELSPDALLLVVNGRIVELDYELQDGDAVNLMPALSGGWR